MQVSTLTRSLILGAISLGSLPLSTAKAQDLTPTAFTVSTSNFRYGVTVQCRSTIRNTNPILISPSCVSGYVVSSNSTISRSDRLFHQFNTPVIFGGASTSHVANVTLPDMTRDAVCYAGVVADFRNTVRETNESNNGLGRAVTCYATNLRVNSLTGVPTSLVEGRSYAVDVNVSNTGRATSRSVRLGLYLGRTSTDTTGQRVADALVSALSPSQSRTIRVTFRMPQPTSTGTCFVVARVDRSNVIQESSEVDNTRGIGSTCSTSVDLVATSLTASTTTWKKDQVITITSRTTNVNSRPSAPSKTGYYLSNNSSITTSDKLIGAYDVPLLGKNGFWSRSGNYRLPAPPSNGACYLGMIVDYTRTNSEASENNNTRSLRGNCELPDLQISNFTASTTRWTTGTRVTLSSRTTNIGSDGAAAHQTGYYLSSNSTITASDQLLGTVAVPFLGRTGFWQSSTPITMPLPRSFGTCYVGAWADRSSAITEGSEANNIATIRGTCENRADLVVSSLTASTRAWRSGSNVAVTTRTANIGANTSAATTTSLYYSDDSTITTADTVLSSISVPTLARGASSSVARTIRVPVLRRTGTCYLGAIADRLGRVAESSETNNTRALSISCTQAADLRVSGVSVSTTWSASQTGSVRFTVSNIGGDTTPTYDALLSLSGHKLRVVRLAGLARGISRTYNFSARIPAYLLGDSQSNVVVEIRVDSSNEVTELSESNNLFRASRRLVRYSGTDRYIEFDSRFSHQFPNLSTLDANRSPRTARLEVTAPDNPRGFYLLLWSGSSTFAIDPLTNLGLALLNTPVLPNWFAALDANGRTSAIKPQINLPRTTLAAPINAYMHGIFWTPTFQLKGVASTPISRLRINP